MNNKFLLSTSLSLLVTCQTAFASEEKNHNLIFNFSHINIDQEYGDTNFLGNDSDVFLGFGYGYNINLGQNFFLKPKFMFYLSDIDIDDKDDADYKSIYSNIKDLLIDVGYKQNKLSYYTSIGIRTATIDRTFSTYNKTRSGAVFGLGVSYDVTDNIDVNVGYQYSRIAYQDTLETLNVDFQDIKLGMSYKF